MKFRDRIVQFMYGRNGVDQLGRAELTVVMVLVIVSMFCRKTIVGPILDLIGLAGFVHLYFRMFSRNLAKRQRENQWFLNLRYDWVVKWNKRKSHHEQKKIYRFFSCPMCHQKVRVPKGRGKICITCPKCREEFVRKS